MNPTEAQQKAQAVLGDWNAGKGSLRDLIAEALLTAEAVERDEILTLLTDYEAPGGVLIHTSVMSAIRSRGQA